MAEHPNTQAAVEGLYASIEAAHRHLATIRAVKPHREAGRAFALVATKLDEARLWSDEALALSEEAQQPAEDRP